MQVGDGYYQTETGEFDHERFVDTLLQREGDWLVSYDENIPDELERFNTAQRTKTSTYGSERNEKVESLTMNYDPTKVAMFRETEQNGLEAYTE